MILDDVKNGICEHGQETGETPLDSNCGFGCTTDPIDFFPEFDSDGTLLALGVEFKRLTPTAKAPAKNDPEKENFCWDLYADEDVVIRPGEYATISTGIAFNFPERWGCYLWDRSGMGAKQGLHRFAGVIDPGYTGEVKVCLFNANIGLSVIWDYVVRRVRDNIHNLLLFWRPERTTESPYTKVIRKGDKIIQLELAYNPKATMIETESLPETVRGAKGFGSSDKRGT